MGEQWKVTDFLFLGSKITADGDCSHEIKRRLLLGRKAMTNLDSVLKSRHYFANKGPSSQSYGFSSSCAWMWELDYKESWALKNWCFWTVVLEKTLESSLDCKEIKRVNPTGNQSEYSLEGLILKLKLQHFGHLMQRTDAKTDAGKDWRQEWEKETIEDKMVKMVSLTQWTWVWANSRSRW